MRVLLQHHHQHLLLLLLLLLLPFLVDRVCAQYARLAMMDGNQLDVDDDDDQHLLVPQYYWHPAALAGSPPLFAKRDGDCGTDLHPCSDINSTLCCPDTTYCLVNSTTWRAQCCELGSSCGEACGPDRYLFNYTSTITTTSSSTATTVLSTYAACRDRACTSANYLCPSSLGGGCCAYGSDCGTDAAGQGICLATAGGTTSTASTEAVRTVVTPVASGCTAQGQTYCTAGGGCCDAGYACTLVSSRPMCSPAPATPSSSSPLTAPAPTGSGITVEHESPGDSLSSGAKAGIAVGVVAFAAAVLGLLAWFCLRRRRRAAGAASAPTVSGQEMRSFVPPGGGGVAAGDAPGGGGGGGGGWGERNLSEADGTSLGYPASTAGTSRAGYGYQDYFGPGSVTNYMEMGAGTLGTTAAAGGGDGAAAAPTAPPPLLHNEHHRPGSPEMYAAGGVGAVDAAGPHSPVEMAVATRDPSSPRPQHARIPSDRSDGGQSELADTSSAARDVGRHPQASPHTIAGVFELMGSPTSPVGPDGREGGADGDGGGGAVVGGNRMLPQPLPTPASEMSDFGTPSPMSREE